MIRSRQWRKRMIGFVAITKRLAFATLRLWPTAGDRRRKRESQSDAQWDVLDPQMQAEKGAIRGEAVVPSTVFLSSPRFEMGSPANVLLTQETEVSWTLQEVALGDVLHVHEDSEGLSSRDRLVIANCAQIFEPKLDNEPPLELHRHSVATTLDNNEGKSNTTIQEADIESSSLDALGHGNAKRVSLSDIPISVLDRCAPSELPEDVERLIFEMATRDDKLSAMNTLIFLNHRIRKWVEYVIYEVVLLKDAKHARQFLAGIESKHRDFAMGAVKVLALPTRVSFDTSIKILSLCKNIQHLSWLPTNPLPIDVLDMVSQLPLVSLRARLSSYLGSQPDFSASLFRGLKILFVSDHTDVWKMWTWKGIQTQHTLKWLAFNIGSHLHHTSHWDPVRVLEYAVLRRYGGADAIRLCICYSPNYSSEGDKWIHRSEETFSEERMVVLGIRSRFDEQAWKLRVTGERNDFEISEALVRERQTDEKRLFFSRCRTSLVSGTGS